MDHGSIYHHTPAVLLREGPDIHIVLPWDRNVIRTLDDEEHVPGQPEKS